MNRGSKIITMKTTPIIKQNTYDYSLNYNIFFELFQYIIAIGFVKNHQWMQRKNMRMPKRKPRRN